VTQNRADLFVLAFAVMEMADSGGVVAGYLGNGTMKMVRLMKVLRPIRLLMRSQGLKTIIEALVACRKPIFYAALFLLILSSVFAVSLVLYPQTSISRCIAEGESHSHALALGLAFCVRTRSV